MICVKRRMLNLFSYLIYADNVVNRHDANAQIQCPVEKGIHTLIQDFELPSHIPPGEHI